MFRSNPRIICFCALALLGQSGVPQIGVAAPKVSPDSPQAAPIVAVAEPALFRYQLALDRLAAGDVASARVLAGEARKRYGDAPEINLLLAYLLQREGRNTEAQAALDAVKNASPLAAQFAAQLDGAKTSDLIVNVAAPTAAPTATLPKTVSLPQSDANLARLETLLAQRVNAERIKAKLEPLVFDSALANVSRAHSAEMRDLKYFAHESPNEELKNPIDRYRAAFGATPHVIAENVYRSWGSPRKVGEKETEDAHQSLMKSPGHRANILYPDVKRIGIGIIANANGDLWVTQMFSRT